MYTATMLYNFKSDGFEKACKIWKSEVMELAKNQEGFVRMQFLTAKPKAMAIGTWQKKEFAQEFMATGVFIKLMEKLEPLLLEKPIPSVWDLKYFEEK